jgi:hypothetical protein
MLKAMKKLLRMMDESVEKRHKREHEWCRCGKRRVYVAHEWTYRWRKQRYWWNNDPPHKFTREADILRAIDYERREKEEMLQADREFGWSEK